jgi:hypothetical protein
MYQYTIADLAGNWVTYTATNYTKYDTTAPSGGYVTYTNASTNATTITVSFSTGTDASSGLNDSTGAVQRKDAAFTHGVCGAYSTFASVNASVTGTFVDANVTNGTCYMYQYKIADAAGNYVTYTNANYTKVDTEAPSGGYVSYTNATLNITSMTVTFARGADAGADLNNSSGQLQRKEATYALGVCGTFNNFSTVNTSTSGTYSETNLTNGYCYMYRYIISDLAGNQVAYTSTNYTKVDTTVPTISNITIISNNAINTSLGAVGDTLTLNFKLSEQPAALAVTIAGGSATVTNSSLNYTATYTLVGTEPQGVASILINMTDGAYTVFGNNTNDSTYVYVLATNGVSLVAGWNLISFNITPQNTSLAKVFAPVANNTTIVRFYQNGAWTDYTPGVGGTLLTITQGMAYFVNATGPVTLYVSGTQLGSSYSGSPPVGTAPFSIAVYSGWNLLGVYTNASVGASTINDVTGNYAYTNLYKFNSTTQTLFPVVGSTGIAARDGFWLNAASAGSYSPRT